MSDRPDVWQPLRVHLGVGSDPGRLLVRLDGDIDLATAPVLERQLAHWVRDGARLVILDLSDVSFCDVSGLRALLRADDQLRSRGGRLHLVGPCHWMERMVTSLGLSDRLGVPHDGDGPRAAGEDAAGEGNGLGR